MVMHIFMFTHAQSRNGWSRLPGAPDRLFCGDGLGPAIQLGFRKNTLYTLYYNRMCSIILYYIILYHVILRHARV